ncbi:MAG: fibronectin type III domain-containing protein, partial [bacterium]|nr:fibronectin type III domain-containing protein [bacterium]
MEDRIKAELSVHLGEWLSTNPEMENFSVTGAMQSIFNSLPAEINPLGSGSSSDSQAPTVPTNLSATTVSSSQINLSWNASSDNVGVTGYRIYRNGGQIASTASTSYSNSGLLPSTQYTYTVSAHDAANNSSSQSTPASATTQPAGDSVPPSVSLTSPAAGSVLSGTVTLT